ncbi:MBL fold metallo-hydrolase [Polynucleobacter sphagniphilus]|jgi:glyoxylase-like metal-dependent hydrolase (beta-lactamase superfamily II)|uniref:MBL fold metallo-hydrolase n=1 Tax=Polynucleobacter sphagniphilus TaxID=1743169 RepID=UPI00096B83D9|nr:MBL fold metallo-hydrolase [Polynucleobacter sphagniphilus]MDF9788855.1 glyoxylase-like metal-dependent hydrolase (beta-lactamase superfamily II) [Polynucleobacter sphagniphilus]MDH6250011.1 glyoxylase-like metal-dependent hydrolase (beta-lactamase superfamily II) [Polynucleobacter sphagniphilus]MDH6302265.1 glyoxylase-like metal-dependent hydrolase (beta-lactamase superfamily II) [Polynucleobacter sphagniphilus]MDH6421947.1 glyoxylase-like metal-dependent hydrolase (beta-lactamase superfami
MASYYLPPGIEIFERGWLSANSIFHFGDDDVSLVDSGYCAHQTMTVDLVKHALQSHRLQALKKVVNTHLHSDHCGGNAALSQEFACDIYIPQAEEIAVREWNEDLLSYQNLGQECPRFKAQGVLIPGESIWLGQYPWKIFSAPGHDPHSIMLYQADYQILISADALWESGFGVVFPELWGEGGFEEVAQTLRLIEGLPIQLVIPGHGKPFTDIAKAIAIAYSRLDYLSSDPTRNARHGAKVLLKYKLLEWRNKSLDEVNAWVKNTPTLKNIAQQLSMDLDELAFWLPQSLVQSGVATIESGCLVNIG